jgi:tRNA U34 2-thiouridine synthase MnmA/TrmU
VDLHTLSWVDGDPTAGLRSPSDGVGLIAQCSAHGRPVPVVASPDPGGVTVRFDSPQRRIAPGQTVALYDPDHPDAVVGSGIAR